MSFKTAFHYATDSLIPLMEIPGDGAILVRGTTVPTDGSAGYAKGCIFIDTDGTAGSTIYVNEGSRTSCDFNLALVDESTFLDGVTAGTVTASKALVVDSGKRLGTVTELAVTTPIVGQGTPTAETGVATITIADILTGIVTITHATGATVALTLDTGTAMDTGKPATLGTDQAIDWTVINLSAAAADTATITAASGHTVIGTMVVQSAHSTTGGIHGNAIRLRSRRTAANTWVTYRLG